MRGKVIFQPSISYLHRITPACAGKSSLHLSLVQSKSGSPPRVRGKAIGRCFGARSTRITPACAGKSDDDRRKRNVIWDHPRVCGEKRFAGCGGAKSPGSPPRVRGKGAPEKYTECQWRITPACAGKSTSRRFMIA